MRLRYQLGAAWGGHPAHCFITDKEEPSFPLIVTGPNQRYAQSKAARLVDLLNDPGMPFYLTLNEPQRAAPIYRPNFGGRR
jgi:hypothetical protein